MAEQRQPPSPPGHRGARLVILAVLAGAALAGGLSDTAAQGAGWSIDQGRRIVTRIWEPLLPDREGEPVQPSPSPSATPSKRS